MEINISDCELSQSLYTLINCCSSTGNATISLYEKESNWINANRAVPFLYQKGIMQWRVPLEKAQLSDLVKTFQMNAGCQMAFEIVETQFWSSWKLNEDKLLKCFLKYWKRAIRLWGPGRVRIPGNVIKNFVQSTGVLPCMVFHAIWIRDFYTLDEFCELFSVEKKTGKQILLAAGYGKKSCDMSWQINWNRRADVEKCLQSAEDAVKQLGPLVEGYNRGRNGIARSIAMLGEWIKNKGEKFGFQTNAISSYDEPAYGKRTEWPEHLLIAFICLVMLAFSVYVIKSFSDQLRMAQGESLDAIYGFWSGIVGALLAGLVTIFTTYFIIRRSYKVDYHVERIAAMPFFTVKTVSLDFSLEKALPEKVENIRKKNACDCIDGSLDHNYMMISIKNQGRGPAYHVEIAGRWPDYEDASSRSIMVDEQKYLLIPFYESERVRLTYYDLYGNFYSQEFYGNVNETRTYMRFESDPPRLELRTNRIRYRQ